MVFADGEQERRRFHSFILKEQTRLNITYKIQKMGRFAGYFINRIIAAKFFSI
jgi:hypothetical protein